MVSRTLMGGVVWSMTMLTIVTAPMPGAFRTVLTAAGQPTVLDGVYSTAQAERGSQKFKETCAACHNIDEMSGGRFRSSWADQSLGDLFDFVSSAMPQGDPGSLTPEEYAGVIAFFLSQSGYPAGPTDLPASKDELSKLKVLALPQ